MKPVLKLKFTDFWANFIPARSHFFKLLSRIYTIELSDTPDILIYSCYGNDYVKYRCVRIYFSPENIRPDFTGCDFAITFDYLDDPRHFRFPLYGMYIDQYNAIPVLTNRKSREEAMEIWKKKTKFCCMVVSNGKAKNRIRFFDKLSAYKNVDSGGKYRNNVGGPVPDKLTFISDYKFVISFENSSSPGYTTEKILEPMIVDSIPVYWGNPLVGNDFNKKCFLDYRDFENEELLISKMLEIEKNPELGVEMLMEPKFPNNQIPEDINEERLLAFLQHIVINMHQITPVARTLKKYFHAVRKEIRTINHYTRVLLNKNFR